MVAAFLSLANEILTAAIVIVAVSMLLYNLSRNRYDRVARTSGAVLACVTVAYTVDVFTSLQPNIQQYEYALRLQWIGLAFLPAALFHLSDALLATTGLASRGRRRLGVRILYTVSTAFLLLALFSDSLIRIEALSNNAAAASLSAGILFGVYVAYFLSASGLAFINVDRARKRCLTRDTRRRMAYLQMALLTPAIGTFPYSVLLGPGNEFSLAALIMVNIANAVVILMLIFLSYPLSFFGSKIPDRVVKSELLSFFMRGPATGLIVLAVITITTQASQILGIAGEEFMPFAVVTVVLMWQWTTALTLPAIETYLIYSDEDSEQLNKLRQLSDRTLSQGDLLQLTDAVLQAACDYLRVKTAFVAVINRENPEIIAHVGSNIPTDTELRDNQQAMLDTLGKIVVIDRGTPLQVWSDYWIAPLYSLRLTDGNDQPTLMGVFGIEARAEAINLTEDDNERLSTFTHQIEKTLDDLLLQGEIFAALEGLLPQIKMNRTQAAIVEYKPGYSSQPTKPSTLPEYEQLLEQVKAALRHYWGGPGLTHSRLLELNIVRDCMEKTDNPTHALRSVLQEAIERQRPQGERKNTAPEWTLYNILEMRFVQGAKVSEVARRLAISEATFHRKQRAAIEAIAQTLEQMELERN